MDQLVNIKEINQQRILSLLRLHPGISRAELVRRTDLGKATVSQIVADFVRAGVVREIGTAASRESPGRRPVELELARGARLAIGIELTGSSCIAAITDVYARPLRVIRYAMAESSVSTAVDLVVRAVNELAAGHNPSRLLGVGVGAPGVVDLAGRRVIQSVNIGWLDVPLASMLEEHIGKSVTVAKRQNAGALGEHTHGIGAGQANLLYISVGVGIGCGIIVDNELYEGTSGSAGEIGHTTIVPDGFRCNCGNTGCLETLASFPAIAIRARERARDGRPSLLTGWTNGLLQSINSALVIKAAAQGDALAVDVVQEAARYLGIGIANLINLFNPALIIVGGVLSELGDLYLEPVRQAIRQRALSMPLASVRVVPSSLGDQAAVIGAATLVLDRFFAQANPFAAELAGRHAR